jgi:hypothetical protein
VVWPGLGAGALVVALGAAALVIGGPRAAAAVSITAITTVAVLARLSLPGKPRSPLPARPDLPAPDFPAYRQIASMLGWAATNGRYYDVRLRPFLLATAEALLADRRRIDLSPELSGHPSTAAELLGADVWALLDPAVRRESDHPVDQATVARIADVLEQL